MREVVDHYFPPVSTLVKGGGEEYTDFAYWREPVLEVDDFSDSESGDTEEDEDNGSDEDDEEGNDALADSYISRDSIDDENEDENGLEESILSGSIDEDENMTSSMLEADEPETDEEDEGVTPGAEQLPEDDDTQVVNLAALKPSPSAPAEDLIAETITGIKGLSLEREDSDDKKV